MNCFFRTAAVLAAVTATSLGCLPAAYAQEPVTSDGGPPFAGVVGIQTGGVAFDLSGGSRYYQTPVVSPDYSYIGPDVEEPGFTYVPPLAFATTYSSVSFISPVPVHTNAAAVGLQPWSPQWYTYCQNRYRSFDPGSGTFTGYDGRKHLCAG
ncbi:BA14K family protein [Mesorhizobium sp. KR1-2]|uniref:BA14K family protein n=1 Tax=Mesorhizobium sp. KR1-2 TaxID=3156609 RepID=UPI0032B52E53